MALEILKSGIYVQEILRLSRFFFLNIFDGSKLLNLRLGVEIEGKIIFGNMDTESKIKIVENSCKN